MCSVNDNVILSSAEVGDSIKTADALRQAIIQGGFYDTVSS